MSHNISISIENDKGTLEKSWRHTNHAKKYYFSKIVYKRNIINKIDYKTKFELRGQVTVLM